MGTKCWVAGLPGDSTGSRGHVTPASKNQERKTRRGEQEPHGRWEEPFPDVVLVPGNSTVSVQPRQTPSVPRSPQGCCDRTTDSWAKTTQRCFLPVLEPRSQKSGCQQVVPSGGPETSLPAPGASWCLTVCRGTAPSSTSIITPPFHLCLLPFSSLTRTSLVVQWLSLCNPNAEGPGSIPGQETRSHMPQLRDPAQPNK